METETRFAFGQNWAEFADHINNQRVNAAVESLRARLGDLTGLRFLDVGCGSGLFSVAAVLLGASEVRAFDYDSDSVTTAQRLLDGRAQIHQGSILDADFVAALGEWDVVYSWGVLHHTGDMRQAWENVCGLAAPGGRLFISIYNDQGGLSVQWARIKKTYNRLPEWLRPLFVVAVMAPIELRDLAYNTLRRHPEVFFNAWTDRDRGMSRWHDLVDWVGGYPFEVAKPEEVFEFFCARGFQLEWMKTCAGGLGCNEFVFTKPHG